MDIIIHYRQIDQVPDLLRENPGTQVFVRGDKYRLNGGEMKANIYYVAEGLLRFCKSNEAFREVLLDRPMCDRIIEEAEWTDLFDLMKDWYLKPGLALLFAIKVAKMHGFLRTMDFLGRWSAYILTAIDAQSKEEICLYLEHVNGEYDITYKIIKHLEQFPENTNFFLSNYRHLFEKLNREVYYVSFGLANFPVFFEQLIDAGIPTTGLDEVLMMGDIPTWAIENRLEELYRLGIRVTWLFEEEDEDEEDKISTLSFQLFAKNVLLQTSPCFAPGAWWARTSYLLGGATYQIVDSGLE